MRRSDLELSRKAALEVLKEADWGTLSVLAPDGGPCCVPVNHVVYEGDVFFHCAAEGEKLDCIRTDPRACFCAVSRCRVLPDSLSTSYRSAVVRGLAERVSDGSLRDAVLMALTARHAPGMEEEARAAVDGADGRVAVVRIRVTELTGKESRG